MPEAPFSPYSYLNTHSHTHIPDGADPVSIDDLWSPLSPAVGDILVASTVNGKIVFRPYRISVPGANVRNALVLDNGDTTPTYKATLDSTAPTNVSPTSVAAAGTSLIFSHRDHTHGASDIASATTLTNFINNHLAATVGASGQQLTSNSAVMQNITNVVIPVGTSQVWKFSGTIIGLSSAAADWQFTFTGPAASVIHWATAQHVNAAGATVLVSQAAAGTAVNVTGTGANYPVEVFGTIVTGGTAGNLQLQAAQNTATVENTDFIVAGTNVIATRVL